MLETYFTKKFHFNSEIQVFEVEKVIIFVAKSSAELMSNMFGYIQVVSKPSLKEIEAVTIRKNFLDPSKRW